MDQARNLHYVDWLDQEDVGRVLPVLTSRSHCGVVLGLPFRNIVADSA
jgi:hypothetical protein